MDPQAQFKQEFEQIIEKVLPKKYNCQIVRMYLSDTSEISYNLKKIHSWF